MQAIGDDRRDHDQDRPEQRDDRPGAVGDGIGGRGPVGEGEEDAEPAVAGEGPGEPEEPERPELDKDAQTGAQKIVGGAADHSATAATTDGWPAGVSAVTRRAVPRWV